MNNSVECKNIGVDWIGSIPSNWKVSRFKHLFDEKKSTKNPELNSGSISFGQVIYKNDESIPESTKEGYQEVLEGEFLINPLNLNYDLKSLRIALSRINVVVSQGYIVLKLRDHLHPNYYEYLLRKFDVEHMKSLGQGVRQTISFTHLKDENLVVPPIEEQKLISRYLDKKTSQIDSLVEKIQKKIELLKEQQTSLINHYVTKGLDPNVEMKDSGIEWIGVIPKHWRISKLKYLISILGGGTPNTETKEYWGGNIPWVSPKDMKTDLIDTSEDFITELGLKESTTNLIEPMSLLIVFRSGILQRTIPVGRNLVPVAINQDVKAVTSKDSGFLLDFLFLWIKGNEQNLLKQWSKKGVTVESLESDYLLNSIIPIPPLDEQITIKEKLKFLEYNYSRLLGLLENKIQILVEYRQSLISSVVTGKVRVTEDMI